jgi:hypothetical protein
MVSKPLIISLLCVGAVAAADTLWKNAPSENAVQSSTPSQVTLETDASRTHAGGEATSGSNSLSNPLAQTSPRAFDVIAERTLFSPTRRQSVVVLQPVQVPVIQEVAQAVPLIPAPDPHDFTLLGVVIADQSRIALLRWNKTQETLRLRSGDTYTGWKIAAIYDRNILMEQQGKSFSLMLFKGQGGEQAAIAAQD